ncbi:MAG TPA: hypothetical protein ACFYD1_02310 [Candidatus Hypogeohydataceae bacterium YC38]|nr:hypothetical protein [Candidatus Brocadiales bacterium]
MGLKEVEKGLYKPLDFEGLKTYSIKDRKNLVSVRDFARPVPPPRDFKEFLDSLPHSMAAGRFLKVAESIVAAHKKGCPVVMAMGAHVVKCGLSPLVIDLMERGILSAVAMNSATAIHDYEISLIGATSEDVQSGLKDGSFGMARETAQAFQAASSRGVREGIGLGAALGKNINQDGNKYASYSILSAADRLDIPATVHTTIGADTVHMHPNMSGKDLGGASYVDFQILAGVVANLEGGVWLNVGSAVVMPEVFLKTLSVARNLGHRVENFAAVDMDMLQHYRPTVNVVKRPTQQGYSLTGHHELMLPLLRISILSILNNRT